MSRLITGCMFALVIFLLNASPTFAKLAPLEQPSFNRFFPPRNHYWYGFFPPPVLATEAPPMPGCPALGTEWKKLWPVLAKQGKAGAWTDDPWGFSVRAILQDTGPNLATRGKQLVVPFLLPQLALDISHKVDFKDPAVQGLLGLLARDAILGCHGVKLRGIKF